MYGSMDGASKFVRGDAVAGIIIMLINVIGGLIVGLVQHGLDLQTAINNYTLLTIGDGLVAQIPALVISTAAGIVVTRVATDEDLSEQLLSQLFKRSQVLYLTASVLAVLGLIPGMPHVAFLLMAAALAGIAYMMEQMAPATAEQAPEPEMLAPEPVEVGWHDVQQVDVLGLEVGYRLIPLVDKAQDGELLRRIRGIRKKFAQEMGFLVPPVHIRDNLELKPSAYRITLKGVEVGQGEAFAGQYLAINPGRVLGALPGVATHDPTFGLPAVWVEAALREQAQTFGYTVVDASTVVATHMSNVIQTHAAELLGREETQQLLDHLSQEAPKLVEEVVPKLVPLGVLQKVLQNLLDEGVHIRDMRTILDVLAEYGGKTQDPDELTEAVRTRLGRAIIHTIYPGVGELQVIALDPSLEQILMQLSRAKAGEGVGLEPGLAESILRQADASVQQQEQLGLPAVLLVPAPLRQIMSRFLRRSLPQLKVLSHAEVPENKSIRITSVLGARA